MPFPVVLHVYDLTRGMARQMSASLLGRQIEGVWHTGVFVYGKEYFFGGGIQAIHPSFVVSTYGQPVQVVQLGETEVPPEEFASFLQEISPRFTAATYNLLSHNCNNFSNEVAQFLLGSGIPQHILDLPNEVLSTPMGAMFRPMIENMQAEMARSVQSNSDVTPPSTAFQSFPSSISTATATPASTPAKPLTSYVKPVVSGSGDLHFDRILASLQSNHTLSASDIAALTRLGAVSTSSSPIDPTDRSTWWSVVAGALANSSATFSALCLLRVVLLAEITSNTAESIAAINDVLDTIVHRCEQASDLPSAHRILYLSVLINGLVAPSTAPFLDTHAARFLPFVWSTWHAATIVPTQAALSAAVVFNVSRRVQPASADDMVQFTIVGGCAEVLDVYASTVAIDVQAVERLVAGLGLLIKQCPAARSLAVEVGLVQVLSRLKPKTAATSCGGITSEVLALI
ncbi:unnamed protein product [Aphanomyces euteiches]